MHSRKHRSHRTAHVANRVLDMPLADCYITEIMLWLTTTQMANRGAQRQKRFVRDLAVRVWHQLVTIAKKADEAERDATKAEDSVAEVNGWVVNFVPSW